MLTFISFLASHTTDAESNSKMLKTLLSKVGVSSFTAENGQVAVDMVLQDKDLFDIVFMDNQMPVMVPNIIPLCFPTLDDLLILSVYVL